ncbi:MAG: ORF6N domain-containing protein [Candidatus Delongbacteria bacterium]|nr:ORF6N domain-containing protein [Candidatus Delongbacteria bacterium]
MSEYDLEKFEREIKNKIYSIRGYQVMLDRDLAELYGVETKVLNQAVKRNKERFPSGFCFMLTQVEKDEVVTICDHLSNLRFSYNLPYAFTEQGGLNEWE